MKQSKQAKLQERYTSAPTLVRKRSGEQEQFSRDKLCDSLVRAGADISVAQTICDKLEQSLNPVVTSSTVWREALRKLVRADVTAGARYSIRRGISQLGPDGFLFEKFIATLFEQYGYTARTNRMQKGISGLEHETDVVLQKGNTISFLEVKYKNEYGLKTHVDTVMYSYARFEDMVAYEQAQGSTHEYELWLVTNTEFTTSCHIYAHYKKIHLLGWETTPTSLEDMIVDKKVYPVTILPSLTQAERKEFVTRGIMLAQDLLLYTDQDLVRLFQIHPKRAPVIHAEVQALLS